MHMPLTILGKAIFLSCAAIVFTFGAGEQSARAADLGQAVNGGIAAQPQPGPARIGPVTGQLKVRGRLL